MSETVGTNGEAVEQEAKSRAPAIPAAVFVKEWQRAPSLAEAVHVLGKNASLRAATLRKKGVNLKKFNTTPRGRAKLDIDALNMLADNALND